MKKARTKLTLHRETITNLTDGRMGQVAGGAPPKTNQTICNSICLTVCCPTNQSMCISGCAGPCNTQTGCIETYTCQTA